MKWNVGALTILVAVSSVVSDCVASNGGELKKDTLFYVSFLNLVERALRPNTGNFSKDYQLGPEEEVMNQVIRKQFGKNFTLLKVPDSCFASVKNDSVLRRDEKFVQRTCEKCHLRNRVIILDAIWSYLDAGTMWGLRLRRASSPSYWITGTWWSVHAFVYSSKEHKYLMTVFKAYTQWNDRRPVKRWPGISHKRFFERPLKGIGKILIKSNST